MPGLPISPARKTASGKPDFRVNNFDLLRLFAATQVLLFHSLHRLHLLTPFWLKPLEWFPGVPIFFVVSGYLVSSSYERNNGDLFRYFRNRFLRIYPGLWVCILVTAVVVLCFGYRFQHLPDFAWLGIQPLGFIYTPHFLDSFGSGTYNGSLWTIPLELQFYIMLPLVYLLSPASARTKRPAVAIFFIFLLLGLLLAHLFPGTDRPRDQNGEAHTLLLHSPVLSLPVRHAAAEIQGVRVAHCLQ